MRGGGEGRGEADAAGLPGEEAGVGEQTQPLSSTAGEPGSKDTAGAVSQPGAAGTVDTRGISLPLWRRASVGPRAQDVFD